jgi:hypothetical protein
MRNCAKALAGAASVLAVAACSTTAYSTPFTPTTEYPFPVLDFISEMHEVKLGETVVARLFIGYSFAEPDQFSYLQLMLVNDIPGVDSVEVYDLEANLGEEIWITAVEAVDANTLRLTTMDKEILIKVDGLAAAAK